MQYIQPGSNKRVVFLSARQSTIYLRNQVLDIMHDAGIENVTDINVGAISALIAHWIVEINGLDWRAEHEIVNAIVVEFMPFIGATVDRIARDLLSRAPIRETRTAMLSVRHIINDNCAHQGTRRCVAARSQSPAVDVGTLCDAREIVTFSTLFDVGSFSVTCGGRQEFVTTEANIPYAMWRPEVAQMLLGALSEHTDFLLPIDDNGPEFHSALIVKCGAQFSRPEDVARVIAEDARDLCIAGRFVWSPFPIIIAYRGISSTPIYDGTGDWACQYTHFYDASHLVVSRSTSQTRKVASRVIAAWVNLVVGLRKHACEVANIASAEALRAYAEVSAKHWGDLGMIIDAAREPDIIMITSDKMAQVLCMQFGANCANCAQGGVDVRSADIMIPRTSDDVQIANYENTADIFSTISGMFP